MTRDIKCVLARDIKCVLTRDIKCVLTRDIQITSSKNKSSPAETAVSTSPTCSTFEIDQSINQ